MLKRHIDINDFHFNRNSIILDHSKQKLCFHTYNVQNRRQRDKILKDFETSVTLQAQKEEGLDINCIIGIARTTKIDIMSISETTSNNLHRVIY